MLITKLTLTVTTFALVLGSLSSPARAHCQIPCGIYHDHLRVTMMREDLETIRKAVRQINALAGKSDAQSANQRVRWISNKDDHAERIIRTISDYFMTQKIVPPAKKGDKAERAYLEQLARHHAVMVAAMHCKQNASLEPTVKLEQALNAIAGYWPEGKK